MSSNAPLSTYGNGKSQSTNNYSNPVTFNAQNAGVKNFQSVSVLNDSTTATVNVYLTSQPTGLPFVTVGPLESLTFPCQATQFLTFTFTGGTNGDGQVTLHGDSSPLSSTSGNVTVSFPLFTGSPGFINFNGLLIQWGNAVYPQGQQYADIYFLQPFKYQIFMVTGNAQLNGSGYNPQFNLNQMLTANFQYAGTLTQFFVTVNGFDINGNTANMPIINWIAVGN